MSKSDAFAIEAFGEPAGLVVRLDHGFRFFAANRPFHVIDGVVFRRIAEVERAVRRLAAGERMAGGRRAA